MSWDVMLFTEKFDYETVTEETMPLPLGTREEVKQKLDMCWTNIDWEADSPDYGLWGYYIAADFTIEIGLGKKEELKESLTLYVRGGGNPLEAIIPLCKVWNWHALDLQEGEFIDLDQENTQSFEQWQQFRDAIIEKLKNEGEL